jgi:outer membrane lipoprotein-sorting protein
MTTTDDLDGRLARLRAEWPVGSMVDDVMARIGPAPPRRAPMRRRLFAGLAASGLAASLGLAWLILASQPTTVLAAVQDSLNKAKSAHLTITYWNDRDAAHRSDVWYRKGEGLRVESPDQVIVEDGKTQWSWRPGPAEGEMVVLRQRSPGFFTTQLPAMLALPDVGSEWTQVRTPELDREIDGRACQGFTLSRKGTAQPADKIPIRGLVLAEKDGRIHEITVQRRRDDGSWRREREIRIEYDADFPADKLAADFPAGAKVIDRDKAFDSLYPLDRAIQKVELGGLILAVHDLQPLKDREGFYVVVGVLFLNRPIEALEAMTLLLACGLMIGGLFRSIGSISYQFPQWGWIFVSGLIELALGVMIWMQWPAASFWVIGLFVGIDMLFSGWTWIMLGLRLKHLGGHIHRHDTTIPPAHA